MSLSDGLTGGGSTNHQHSTPAPIPPYEYPPPVARSSPGDSQEQPKKPKVQPYQRPPKAFIEYASPVKPVVPEQPRQQVIMSHPDTVTLPPVQEVIRQQKPSKIVTPEPSKTIPEKEQKEFPKQFGNNSETIRKGNSLEPTKQAPIAAGEGYKKKGQDGRKRKYEEDGNNGEIPVKKVVIFRHVKGRHWPGMSQDMQEWYDKYYFTKPKKTGKAAEYARHVKSYERGQRWIAEHEGRDYQPGTVGHSGTVIAYRKRATS